MAFMRSFYVMKCIVLEFSCGVGFFSELCILVPRKYQGHAPAMLMQGDKTHSVQHGKKSAKNGERISRLMPGNHVIQMRLGRDVKTIHTNSYCRIRQRISP